MKIPNLDLDLLLVFDAIFSEGNVSRAAERLGLSQPQVSKRLVRLRQYFNDPLFLRSGNGVIPTYKAQELNGKVRDVLEAFSSLHTDALPFNPAESKSHFKIGTTDYIACLMVPPLIALLENEAPDISFSIINIDESSPEALLLSGKVDLVISTVTGISFPVYRQHLFWDHYTCLCRAGHPILQGSNQLESFAAYKHIALPRQNGSSDRILKDVLQKLAIQRQVIAHLPHLVSIPPILLKTNTLATVGEKLGRVLARTYGLRLLPHPLPLNEFSISQIWHDRTNRSPSHRWFRSRIESMAQQFSAWV